MFRNKFIYVKSYNNIDAIKGLKIYLYIFSIIYIRNASIRDTYIKNVYDKNNYISDIYIENAFIKNTYIKNIYSIYIFKNLRIYLKLG